MNKRVVLIVGAVVLVVAAGVGGFLLLSDKDSETEAFSNNQSRDEAREPEFNVVANSSVSFEATITEIGGSGSVTKLLYDGKGNSMFDGVSGSDKFAMYKFGNEYISCSGGGCFKLPDGNASQATANIEQYSFNEEKIRSYKDAAKHQGTEQCGDHICDKWFANTGDFTGTFYVDKDQKIRKVVGESDGRQWTVEFDYKPVTIERPANVQDFPML